MRLLNEEYPRAPGERYHRLARCTPHPRLAYLQRERFALFKEVGERVIARDNLVPPTPPGFKSAFMIGKFKEKKLKKEQAVALVRDYTLGLDKPVLTRASAAKDVAARTLVTRVEKEIKLW
jgi:hypothetical protein